MAKQQQGPNDHHGAERAGALDDGAQGNTCSYLPDQTATYEVYAFHQLAASDYELFMNAGFRASGPFVYRPICAACEACIPWRVQVASFQPTRSQRRVWRRNQDVIVRETTPTPTDEKYAMFVAYLDEKHDKQMSSSWESFLDFLYHHGFNRKEFMYFVDGKMVGVSLADVVPSGLSSVYMFYDPAYDKRSLGTYSILYEIRYCQRLRVPFYYLGYWVGKARTMAYKANFMPADILPRGGDWIPAESVGIARNEDHLG